MSNSTADTPRASHKPGEALIIILPLPDPLLTLNKRLHRMARARHTKKQRMDAYLVAVDVRNKNAALIQSDILWDEGRVRVDVEVRPRPRMQRHDDTAIWEALKPVLDGFEDAGIVDDDKRFVVGALVWSKQRTGELIIKLTLTAAG